MVKRQRIVQTPGLHETADEDHAVHDDGEDHPRHDDGMDTNGQAAWQRDMRAAVALAGNRGEVLAGQPETLGEERRKREAQEDNGENSGA
ncbi:hypothetical protein D3C87_1495040 [compost metagenome]